MVKFCEVCGSPLNESGVCPECSPAKAVRSLKKNRTPANVVYLRHKTVSPSTADNTAENEKTNILIPITAVILALCVLSGGIFAAFSFNWFGLRRAVRKSVKTNAAKSESSLSLFVEPFEEPDEPENTYPHSQPQALVRSDFGKIIGDVNISGIRGEPRSRGQVTICRDDGRSVSLFDCSVAADGNVFYGFEGGSADLRKITLTGATSAEDEVWVSAEDLKNSAIGYSFEGTQTYTGDLENFTADGDYVYAYVAARETFREKHTALNYRLVRIGKDSGRVELVGGDNVRASCFLVSDGWIYYADNGYTYSVEKNEYSYSNRRVGLYKMRTDGSGKVLLNGSFSGYKESDDPARLGNAGNLSLCGGKLYYLLLENGRSFLWRMNTDGTQNEKLSDRSADNYAVDTSRNAVYLRSGVFGGSSAEHSLYRLDLETKTSTPMNIKLLANTNRMTVSGGYLYVDDSFRDFENKRLKRISLRDNDNSIQFLMRQSFERISADAQTGIEKRIEEKSPEYRWAAYRSDAPL